MTNPTIEPKSSSPAERAPLRRLRERTKPRTLRRPAKRTPSLRLSPTAWAKLLFLRDLGETEVGGFGLAAADDLLHVEDIQLVRQVCSSVSVAFDDAAVADFFDRQVDQGRKPEQFARIWLHTHPGSSPQPSSTDQDTFARVFGRTDWAVMFILARGGQIYARLRFHVGPGGDVDLPVRVDYTRPFPASDHAAWREEYLSNVQAEDWPAVTPAGRHLEPVTDGLGLPAPQAEEFDLWDDLLGDEPEGFRPQSQERSFFHDDVF
jgi:hypothetical protein